MMFPFSRFLLGGGALASSGGLSAYFMPQLTDTEDNIIYYQDYSSDSNVDYRKLDTVTDEALKQLEKLSSEFKTSKEIATKDKEAKHTRSLELMAQLATSEEALQKLYKHIEEKLKSLGKESKTLSETIQERLKIDSQFQQIKVSQSALNQLVQRLQEWEGQINQVVCAFKQQGDEKNTQVCDSKVTTLLSTVINTSGSSGGEAKPAAAKPQAQTSSQGQTQAQTETEGDKAKKTLEEARKVFESLQESIKSANLSVQKESLKMIWEEIKNYPEWLKLHSKINLLETHIQLINRNIKTTNADASNKVDEINKTNEELVITYNKYNILKKWESSFHSFIEQFQKKILELKSDSFRQVINSSNVKRFSSTK